jgi:hypothetical protein
MLIDNVSHLLVHGNVIHGATVDGLVIQNSDKMSVLGNHLWDAGTAPFKAITNSYGISAGNVISGTSKVFNYDTSNPGDHVLHMLNVADTGSLSTLSMNHSVNMALYNMPGGFPSLAPSAVAVAGGQMTLNSGTLYIASGVASAADWMPLGSRTVVALAANSGTPSVQSGNVFRTSNSVATTYTNFTNGREGETITIIVGDGVTTFDCTGSSIKCNLLADFVASGGDVFQCTLWNSNWYCTIGNN